MKIIKQLAEMIEDELEGSEEYIEHALKLKDTYPELAQTFYELAQTELGHVEILHTQVVRLIEKHKREHGEPPATMLAIWEYVHERHIHEAREIREMISEFHTKS